jgi:DNA invertase Pin-like site-specific DNA recombinase
MTAPLVKKIRCAVYTRKSSEEGLEQAFNSLDAQREAGMAYIASQKHEGWEAIKTLYDDGGYSGGSTDRPALQQLLSDINNGKIDVIVVYKVDRLSRSLHDFAQMMTLFDKHNVSFVSVTQQFNTTTSMGRLTLNILLSFAQFEREVTGERIRDKFAASKKKGMWMGGMPPLGYTVKERQLVIEEQEAILVRKIFTLYLKHHSVLQVADILDKEGHTTKHWQSGSKVWHGGKKLTPGYLNWILRNIVYVGKVKHKAEAFAGQHQAIIDEETWKQVQDGINNRHKEAKHRWSSFYLLKGKLKTHEGFTMSPTSTQRRALKNTGQKIKTQIRYYVSRKALTQGYGNCEIKNINADLLEGLVTGQLFYYLYQHAKENYMAIKQTTDDAEKAYWIREFVHLVTVGPEQVIITLDKQALDAKQESFASPLHNQNGPVEEVVPPTPLHAPDIKHVDDKIHLVLPLQIKRMNGIRTFVSAQGKDLVLPEHPKPDASIVQAIGRGFAWKQMLNENPGLSFKQFEAKVGYCDSFIIKQISLVGLSPDIVQRALSGALPPSINLHRLYEAATSLSWAKQRQQLGLN